MNPYSGKRCIPYYRVSTDDQAERYSLGIQQQLMEQWAERNQVILDQHFIDDHSAKDFRRPGFSKLMAYVQKHRAIIDYILIIDWSRFSRNITESYIKIDELQKLGVQVQAIEQMIDDAIPESTIMKAIFLAAPDAENKRRSINVIKGMRQSLRSGNWCAGRLPRGYWRDRNTMEIKANKEGNLIASAYEKIAHQNYSIKEAQVYLNLRGVNVAFKALTKMLRNPFYMGMIGHKLLGNELVKGNHEPLVKSATWKAVQQILAGNVKSGKTENLFPLKGFVECVRCGARLTGYQVKKKQKPDGSYRIKKSQPIYYKCSCSNIPGVRMHDDFYDILKGLCIEHSLVDDFKNILTQTFHRLSHHQVQDKKLIKKQLTEHQDFLNKLEVKFINGLDAETYQKHRQLTTLNIYKLEKELDSVRELSNPKRFIDFAMRMVTKIHVIWKQSDIINQRRLQNLVFPQGISFDKQNWQYLTPRVNSIFTIIQGLEPLESRKTRPTENVNLVYSTSVVPSTPKSNPYYIEDFINILNENLLEI